jgi:hypothetical protein
MDERLRAKARWARATLSSLSACICCDAATHGAKISLDHEASGWVIGHAANGSRLRTPTGGEEDGLVVNFGRLAESHRGGAAV